MLSQFFPNSHNLSNVGELSWLSWIVRDLIHIQKEREKFVVVRFSLKELYRGGEGGGVGKKEKKEGGKEGEGIGERRKGTPAIML